MTTCVCGAPLNDGDRFCQECGWPRDRAALHDLMDSIGVDATMERIKNATEARIAPDPRLIYTVRR